MVMEEKNYLYCICIEVPRLRVSRTKLTLKTRELRISWPPPTPGTLAASSRLTFRSAALAAAAGGKVKTGSGQISGLEAGVRNSSSSSSSSSSSFAWRLLLVASLYKEVYVSLYSHLKHSRVFKRVRIECQFPKK